MIIIGKNLEFWRDFFFTLENISNFRGILSELGKIFGILLLNLNFVFFLETWDLFSVILMYILRTKVR